MTPPTPRCTRVDPTSTGALTACALAGAEPAAAAAALREFHGARRRMELLGETPSGAAVYDDYAHHPTEVATMVATARSLAPRRVVAVFQPHLYSRTQALGRGFGAALAGDFPGVSGRLVAQYAADSGIGSRPVAWMPGFDEARAFLAATLRADDLCLMMGAGNIDALGRSLVA